MSDLEKHERIQWVDTAKGIGILLVLFGHTRLDSKFIFWIYAFHMPLFFFLSGFTFKCGKSFFDFIKKKFKALIVPYVFITVCTVLIFYVSSVIFGSTYDIKDEFLLYVIQKRHNVVWFISCLFISNTTLYFIEFLSIKKWFQWLASGVVFFILYYFYRHYVDIALPWNLDLSLLSTSFMCLGKSYRIYHSNTDERWITTILFGVISLILSVVNFQLNGQSDMVHCLYGNYIIYFAAAVSGCMFIILLSKRVSMKALSYLGANSMLFYGFHLVIYEYLFVVYDKLGLSFANDSWQYLLLALFSVAIAIVILTPVNMLIMKYCPWVLGRRRVK